MIGYGEHRPSDHSTRHYQRPVEPITLRTHPLWMHVGMLIAKAILLGVCLLGVCLLAASVGAYFGLAVTR